MDVAYAYDAAGNLTERRDAQFGIDQYTYDPVGRITQHIDPQGKLKHYLNDPAGDRLGTRISEERRASGKTPVRDWAREGEHEGASYRFDRAGNLVWRQDERGDLALRWDANQRLVESCLNGVPTRYRYDPLGRRMEKRTGDHSTTFAWDGDALIADALSVGEQAGAGREWVYFPGTFEPLAMLGGAEANGVLHYHNDPNGCPMRLTDAKGETQWAASYTAWGGIAALHVVAVDNPIRLQGQYEDKETGMHYNRHRYYDSTSGEFISQDMLGLAPGINPYEYSPNSIAWIDPLGLTCTLVKSASKKYDYVLKISRKDYPHTAGHISDAIKKGHTDVVTIQRSMAKQNRATSLKPFPTAKGYDRDEWPMAMFKEGGAGSSVRYIDPSDNRGAGSTIGAALRDLPDETKVRFQIMD
jgi:RHS repeat-associated protein